jgi:solute carrier family 25 protein 34/35
MENQGWTHSHGSVSSVFSIAAGAVSGALGAFTASPFYLVKSAHLNIKILCNIQFINFSYCVKIKTQLQSQSSQTIAVGCQHNHTGFLSAIHKLYYSGGITGLWRGVTASMMRTG